MTVGGRRACCRYEALRRERVVGRGPVWFPDSFNDGNLGLELIAGGRALRLGARQVDSIVLALGRSFETRIFLDRQRAVENIAFDDGGAVQLDAACVDRALDLSTDGQVFRDDVALHAGALVDQNVERPQLALNLAEYVQGALAEDLAHDSHAATDGGHLVG